MGNIFLFGEKSIQIFLTNPAMLLSDNMLQCIFNLHHVSDINIRLGQQFFTISSAFCLWLDRDTIGHCSSSQSVCPCTNALDFPFLHAKHRPHHHIGVSLGNLPEYIGLHLSEGGRAWAVKLWLEEAPEAEAEGRGPLSEGGARSIPYSRRSFQIHQTIWLFLDVFRETRK